MTVVSNLKSRPPVGQGVPAEPNLTPSGIEVGRASTRAARLHPAPALIHQSKNPLIPATASSLPAVLERGRRVRSGALHASSLPPLSASSAAPRLRLRIRNFPYRSVTPCNSKKNKKILATPKVHQILSVLSARSAVNNFRSDLYVSCVSRATRHSALLTLHLYELSSS
jgi:hypothetical protein